MPLTNVQIRPGFNKQVTETGAEGQWTDGDFVRFRYGLPEKIGGWEQITGSTLVGAVREQLVWADLDGRRYVALGTNKGLFIYYEGAFYDITPLDTSLTGATFDTTDTSATVTVNYTSHGLRVGDLFTFTNVTPPSGAGYVAADFETNTFQVVTAPDANTFTITMAAAATATTSASGSADINPYATVGPLSQTYGYGWGTDTWGAGGWGEASSTSTVALDPGSWSLDHFGQILIATVKNGKTFKWSPINLDPNALTTRATIVSGAPTKSVMSIVSERDRHLIVLGTETVIGDPTKQDKMFIRFSDQEDISDYTPTSVNTAGTFRLDSGVKIVGAAKAKDYILILTDTSAYVMQFVGPPFTFAFQQVSDTAGSISENCVSMVEGAAYWMTQNNFYVFDGSVQSLECSVHETVFDNLSKNQIEKVTSGTNTKFNEIWWFYPSTNSSTIDKYVIYNYVDRTWSIGSSLNRTAWNDYNIFAVPLAADTDGYIYEQESGYNNVNAAMTAFIETGFFNGDETGNNMYFMDKIIPDTKFESGTDIKFQLKSKRYPNGTETTKGPFTLTSSTNKLNLRARGRSFQAKYFSDAVDTQWRLGTWRAQAQADGTR